MKINNYKFGKIEIDGEIYKNDVIIFPQYVKSEWWRARGHFLQVQDLKDVFKLRPKKLIIGKGYHGFMSVSKEVKQKAEELDINLVAEKSKEACKLYNKEENKDDVVLAIHLTS